MRLLLDTRVLLWWLADDRKLAKDARAIIANPDNDVLVSSASLWEIAIKVALGRLEMELDDLEEAISRNGFRSLPIGFRHALVLAGGAAVAAGPIETVLSDDVLTRAYGMPITVEWRDERAWARKTRDGR